MLPPWPATTGISTASAATWAMTSSNRPTTAAAMKAVTKLIINHGRRLRTTTFTGDKARSSALAPAIFCRSSNASNWPAWSDVLEVHAVNSRHKRQWDENTCHDGQHLHDFVGTIGDRGKIDVDQAGCHFAIHLDDFRRLDAVVIRITEVDPNLVINQHVLVTHHRTDNLALWPNDATQIDEQILGVVQLMQCRSDGFSMTTISRCSR